MKHKQYHQSKHHNPSTRTTKTSIHGATIATVEKEAKETTKTQEKLHKPTQKPTVGSPNKQHKPPSKAAGNRRERTGLHRDEITC